MLTMELVSNVNKCRHHQVVIIRLSSSGCHHRMFNSLQSKIDVTVKTHDTKHNIKYTPFQKNLLHSRNIQNDRQGVPDVRNCILTATPLARSHQQKTSPTGTTNEVHILAVGNRYLSLELPSVPRPSLNQSQNGYYLTLSFDL